MDTATVVITLLGGALVVLCSSRPCPGWLAGGGRAIAAAWKRGGGAIGDSPISAKLEVDDDSGSEGESEGEDEDEDTALTSFGALEESVACVLNRRLCLALAPTSLDTGCFCANPACPAPAVPTGDVPAMVAAAMPLSACAGCRSVLYCCTACQRADWRAHKAQCLAGRAAVPAALATLALQLLLLPAAAAVSGDVGREVTKLLVLGADAGAAIATPPNLPVELQLAAATAAAHRATAPHVAAERGNVAALRAMHAAGVMLGAAEGGARGWTPLRYAAHERHLAAVHALVAHGAVVDDAAVDEAEANAAEERNGAVLPLKRGTDSAAALVAALREAQRLQVGMGVFAGPRTAVDHDVSDDELWE